MEPKRDSLTRACAGEPAGEGTMEETVRDGPTRACAGEEAGEGTMEETERDSPTRACAGEQAGERAMEDTERDSPTRACAGEQAGERTTEETERDSSTRACAGTGTAEAAGPGSPAPADEMGGTSETEMGGAAERVFCADLSEDLIYTILSKLPPCRTEQWAFSCLNQRWNAAVKSVLQPQVPSLILPSSCAPLFHSTVSCQWQEEHSVPAKDCLWKRLYLPKDVRVHGKMCGSSEGGWFVLVLEHADPDKHKQYLFNICTRKMKKLPDTLQISEEIINFSLQAAVVSASPLSPGYRVAAIGKEPSSILAVKRHERDHWENVPCPITTDDCLVDLIYHRSEFWVLTAQERLGKLVEDDDGNGILRIYWTDMNIRQRDSYISDKAAAEEKNLTTKRYLVESKGELYMVQKILVPAGGTIELQVFRLHLNEDEEDSDNSSDSLQIDSDQLYYTWEDASSDLPDQVFFIGQASSRSFQTNSSPRVYFLDDTCTEDLGRPGYFIREDMGFVEIKEDMQFEMPEIYPVLGSPGPDRSSDRVSPCWWIH